MAKFAKKPTNEFDQDLASKGLMRAQVLAESIATDTGKKDSEGNPNFTFGSVYREKIVPINNEPKVKKGVFRMRTDTVKQSKATAVYSFKKAPRAGSKLAQAVEIVQANGKDDKPACIVGIQNAMGVTKGNASIYYAKAKSLIEAGL